MKRGYLIGLLLFFAVAFVCGQNIPEPMSPPRLVNDFAGMFDDGERNALEQMLRNYTDTTSTQIYVVTVADLDGYDVSDYAIRLGEKWGIGQKEKDNGAVILIKPRIGNERGKVFIAVGYGLEPVLTDARCGRIIDNYMLPLFVNDEYYAGTKLAVEAMVRYLSGQFSADEKPKSDPSSLIPILVIIFAFIVIYLRNKNRNKGDDNSSSDHDYFPPIFPTGGGRPFGGGGGFGGFGGSGGGSFGGGGSGRSW
jgi:uncharacterized protein